MTHGTEWTEPGQGATGRELAKAIHPLFHAAAATGTKHIDPAHDRSHRLFGRRTNLRLTGAPLTAEDLARIAEAK